jgi:hypothetical protein
LETITKLTNGKRWKQRNKGSKKFRIELEQERERKTQEKNMEKEKNRRLYIFKMSPMMKIH